MYWSWLPGKAEKASASWHPSDGGGAVGDWRVQAAAAAARGAEGVKEEDKEWAGKGGQRVMWEGDVGGSGKDDKQEKLLNQKVVLDTHFFLEQNIVLCLDRLNHKALIISKNTSSFSWHHSGKCDTTIKLWIQYLCCLYRSLGVQGLFKMERRRRIMSLLHIWRRGEINVFVRLIKHWII